MPNQAERLRTGQNALYYKLCQDKNVRRLLHKMWNDFSYPAAWTHCWSQEMNLWFFFLLVFLLLAARTSFCLFLVRNTRVLFQMRHKCDVSMEACELCMFYLSPMLSFFFVLSSLFPRHNNTWMRFTNIGIAVFDNAEIMWQDFYFILFSFYVREKKKFTFHTG